MKLIALILAMFVSVGWSAVTTGPNNTGTNIINSTIINVTQTGGSSVTNIFTLTSSVTVTNTLIDPNDNNRTWINIVDSTNSMIAGFLHLRGQSTNGDLSDILLHVDITPTNGDPTMAISICQFQGAQIGAPLITYSEVNSNSGHVKIWIAPPNHNYVLTANAYGTNFPALGNFDDDVSSSVSGPSTPMSGQTANNFKTTVNGLISAAALQATTFAVIDGQGQTVNIAYPPSGLVGDGIAIGATSATATFFDGSTVSDWTVGGNLNVTGKITGTGGIDPPYVLYDAHTRAETAVRVYLEVPESKQTGAAQFWNPQTKRLEIFIAKEALFYDLNGNVLSGPTKQEIEAASIVLKADAANRKKRQDDAKKSAVNTHKK